MSRPLTTVDLPDGRTLAYAEWGDPAGRPIVTCHGTPGCRLNRHPNQDLVRSTGARVIAFDRPGYGRSTRNAGRRVVDVVPDVVALVDHLGLDEFAVVGGSGGGPHALAVAASLPDRVTRGVMLPTRVGGTAEEARLYLSQRYGTDISAKAVERYCLYGPPEACAERVAAYVEAGAEHVVFNLALEPGGGLLDEIERLAEVTAKLRSAVGAG